MGAHPVVQRGVRALGSSKLHRAAIHLMGKVVSRLRRAAMTSLPGSFFGRDAKSPSHHFNRLISSTRMRWALLSALSLRNSPEWFSPKYALSSQRIPATRFALGVSITR
jgi:hypothetical protein